MTKYSSSPRPYSKKLMTHLVSRYQALFLNGPKEDLDLTENTQPAIFLISYSIFKLIKEQFNINLNKAKFFAGHSLGEYSALACSGSHCHFLTH